MQKFTKYISLSLVAVATLYAAPPTTGDILRQAQTPKIETEQKALPSLENVYKAPMLMKDDVTTHVKSFTFSGNTLVSSEELNTMLKPFENTDMGINKLKALTSMITKYYRDKGYFVARAYLPEQNLKDGMVEIVIIEGTYGGFEIKNTSLVNNSEIQGFMDYLKNGQIVSTTSLERQMLLINDLSGAIVTNAEVFPGEKVGTSNFSITTSPTKPYSGYAIVDNYGSKYTGENRLSFGANINSVSEVGDLLGFSGLVSDTTDLKKGTVSYDRHLGYSGLKGGLSAEITKYNLDEIPNYEGFGTAATISANLSYPLLKTRSHSQLITLTLANKNLKDSSGIPGTVDESHTSIDSLTLKFDEKRVTNIANHQGRLYTSVGLTGGNVHLKNDKAKTNDTAIQTEGSYTKANISLTHYQQFNEALTLQTNLRGQKSFGKNLDSSEDLSVGGTNGVRAYEDSELSGDQGYALSIDLIYTFPKIDLISHSGSIFFDHARVWKNTTIFNTEDNIRTLNAIGLGYSLSYDNLYIKATYAHGFGSESSPTAEEEFSTSKNKFLLQAMMTF